MTQRNEEPEICFEKIEMTVWQKDFFSFTFSSSKGCYIHYDQHENCALLVGHSNAVRENHYLMLKEINKVKVKLLTLTPSMFCVLSNVKGRAYLQTLFQNTYIPNTKVILQENSLLVASKEEAVLNEGTNYVQTRINYKETIELDVQIPIDKLHFIQSTLENKFLVKVSWTGNDLLIFSVEGIKEDVIKSSKYIKTFVEENRVHEKSFIATGSHAEFLYKKLEGQIRHYLQDFVAADFSSTEVQIAMTFQGDKIKVNRIHRQLTDLTKKVTKSWNLRSEFKKPEDLMLVTKGFNSENIKQYIDGFEASKKCIVIPKLPSLNTFSVSASKSHNKTTADDEDYENEDEEYDETIVEMLPQNPQILNNAEISIVALDDDGIDNLWEEMKNEIAQACLHMEYFNQEIANFWPKESKERIFQEAKKACVWVKLSPNSKTKKPGYIIKGEKQKVEAVLSIIQKEFWEFSSHLPKHQIKSDKAPSRGTREFLKYAADSDEQFPSYWKLNRSKSYMKSASSKLVSKISSNESEQYINLVDVDSKTADAIKKLVANTWNPILVDNDAMGLSHNGIKVVDVKRIENMQMFEAYSMQRKKLFKRMYEAGQMCPDIGILENSKGKVLTSELLEGFMKEEVYYEINEHYLFHGTRYLDAIIANGIDPQVSYGAMFGKGIYTAEVFTKSDQFTDSGIECHLSGKTLTTILVRVLLGNVFLCNKQRTTEICKKSKKLTSSPCMICKEDKCNCENQKLFDSVVGDGKCIFRDFVVFDKSHCYPEYVIYYQRV